MKIKVAGLDPSLRNFGLAKGIYDTDTGEIQITQIFTQHTEAETTKTVRKSSDDLRCAQLLVSAMLEWIKDCHAVFAEIPSGSQSSRGSFSNGVCLGVLASAGATGDFKGRLVQVTPTEVKVRAVGAKNASKEEMIEWAQGQYQKLPWVIIKSGKRKGELSPSNEHMADACAAINAGIQTDEFKNMIQLLKLVQSSEIPSGN